MSKKQSGLFPIGFFFFSTLIKNSSPVYIQKFLKVYWQLININYNKNFILKFAIISFF